MEEDRDKLFAETVKRAMEKGGVSWLANRYEVSPVTVTRWAEGIVRPHPHIRDMIIDGLQYV